MGCADSDWGMDVVGSCRAILNAFRQLPRDPRQERSVLSLCIPRSVDQASFILDALALGEGAAVYGFGRVARAVHVAHCDKVSVRELHRRVPDNRAVCARVGNKYAGAFAQSFGALGWDKEATTQIRNRTG